MCSLSFLPESSGFEMMMNRDELLSRPVALPLDFRMCGGLRALYPCEPGGGTWIGVSEVGITLALINWYERPQRPLDSSRGDIIPALLACRRVEEVAGRLEMLLRREHNPFRLVAVSASEHVLHEWRAGPALECIEHPWERRHWFSSSVDEAGANERRSAVAARNGMTLAELHRSHDPERGAYSICMHREDAQTVSCTAISLSVERAVVTYQDGPPCLGGRVVAETLDFARSFGDTP